MESKYTIPIHGQITITEDQVLTNKMGWSVFELADKLISMQNRFNPYASWFAYRKLSGYYTFKWSSMNVEDQEYLYRIKQNGWIIKNENLP